MIKTANELAELLDGQDTKVFVEVNINEMLLHFPILKAETAINTDGAKTEKVVIIHLTSNTGN